MKITMNGINIIAIFVFLALGNLSFGQNKSGKIVYERKTNLIKKFSELKDNEWLTDYLKTNKYKIDEFELYFNDSVSLFRAKELEVPEEMSWTTTKNTVYQDLFTKKKTAIISLWGTDVLVKNDTLQQVWKITDSKRKIGQFQCRKAIWQMNDSTKIYAWYSEEILSSIGPEGFRGLPGAILGVATEDGGVVYFAKSFEALQPSAKQLELKTKKTKEFTLEEIKAKLLEDVGDSPQGRKNVGYIMDWL
jgi:GLPGLI family protein